MSTSVPPDPASLGLELIPPDPGLINPDLALDAALAPLADVSSGHAPKTFGRSWRFDFQASQFVRDGSAPQVTYELDTLIVWVEKTLRTARLAHPIYSDNFGMEEPFAPVGLQVVDQELADHQDAITAALLYHDRIIAVENFSFSQDPFDETLYASFTVLVDAAPPMQPQPLEFSQVPVGQSSAPVGIDIVDFTQLFSETLARVRARLDADANAGLTEDNPAWIDLREGSFYWDVTQPPAMEMARLWDAMTEAAAAAFPSTAWGDYLDAHGMTFGLTRVPAIAATGSLTFIATQPTLIGIGTRASTAPSQTGDAITYVTTASGTTSDPLTAPQNVVVAVADTGGSLSAGPRYYSVTAHNEYGETTAAPFPGALATATTDTTSNTISWDPVPGASHYAVYVTSTLGAYGELLGTTVATEFVDDGAFVSSAKQPTVNLTSGITLAASAVVPGTAGNVAEGAVVSLDTRLANVYTVTNQVRFQGGAEQESDDDFRLRIIGEYQGSAGGGNIADYRRWVLAQGVERVAVIPIWNGPGTVLVVCMESDGSPVAQTVVDRLQSFLDPEPGQGAGQAPIGAQVSVTTSVLAPIDITATIEMVPGYTLDGTGNTIAIRNLIIRSLTTYLRSLEPGDRVVFRHVGACFFVPGVHNVSDLTVNGTVGGEYPLIGGLNPEVAILGDVTLTEI